MEKNRYAVQFEKDKTFLKAYLLGRGYFLALKALGFVERLIATLPADKQLRKDGVTPGLHHQVRIALTITQLKTLTAERDKIHGYSIEELCITAAILHDVMEDFGTPRVELEHEFGALVIAAVWFSTKKHQGVTKHKELYINEMALNLIASIVKGVDRCDNLEHMVGVFDLKKIIDYTDEARTVFLPMLKRASKLFPEHLAAYQAISQQMKKLIKLLDHYAAAETGQSMAQLQALQSQRSLHQRENDLNAARSTISQLTDVSKRQADALELQGTMINESGLKLLQRLKAAGVIKEGLTRQELIKAFNISSLELLDFNEKVCDGDFQHVVIG